MNEAKKEKYETCIHSTGNIGQLIVYVKPSCPQLSNIKGTLCASKIRCRKCKSWRVRNE